MKMLTKKGILQKIILVILSVLLLNFILPTYSQASFGGVLAGPIIDLLASIGDGVLALVQTCMGYSTKTEGTLSTNPLMIDANDLENYGDDLNAGSAAATSNENNIKKEDLDLGWFNSTNTYSIPIITYSPEQIFSGKIPGLDINFINPNKYTNSDGEEVDSSATTLQPTIAKWYVALRNLSIVGLMCVLVYIGIRIILSSAAADKAKYKQLFTDWLIALCLLFFLHYIMSFTLTMIDAINDSLSASQDGESHNGNNIIVHVDDDKSFRTNLLGSVRFKTQYRDFFPRLQYLIVYLILVGYTVLFTWTYLKRLLNMAFLTIIAPLVALTYPIDKVKDGQAQAFNTWLKEFVYNALLQPFHYIIYMVLVGSASDLIEVNFIYAIAALAFILSAEKILRNIFGFNKAGAGTVGALGGFTGGAIASQLLNKAKSASKGASAPKTGKGDDSPSGNSDGLSGRVRSHDAADLDFSQLNDLPAGSDQTTQENTSPEEDTDNPYEDFQQDLNEHSAGNDLNQEMTPEQMAEQDPNYMYEHPELFQDQNPNPTQQEPSETESGTGDLGGSNNVDNDSGSSELGNNNTPQSQQNINGFQRLYNRHFGARKGSLPGAIMRKTGRGAAKTLGTLAGMSVGAIAGIASGQGLSGMATGALAGAAVGKGLGNKVADAPSAIGRAGSRFASEWSTFRGTEQEHDQKLVEKELMRNEANRKAVADKIYKDTGERASKQQIDAKLESLKPYAREGLTDVKEMMKAQKVEDKYHIDKQQSAKIAAMAKERGITAELLNDKKKYASRLEDMTQEWEEKGLDRAEAQKRASYVLNVMKAQNGQRNDLRNIVKQPTNTGEG